MTLTELRIQSYYKTSRITGKKLLLELSDVSKEEKLVFRIHDTVNVLKFWTLYSIYFGPNFAFYAVVS